MVAAQNQSKAAPPGKAAEVIEVDGVRILHLNFTNARLEDADRLIAECAALVRTQPLKSALTLTDVTGAMFDNKVAGQMKVYAQGNQPYVRAGVIIGVTGIKKAVYRAVILFTGRDIKLFDTIEEGKRHLVSRAREKVS